MPNGSSSALLEAHTPAPPGPPDEVATDVYALPATQAQGRFWSLDQLDSGNPGLNMPLLWQGMGELRPDLLAEAFEQCVERHESLRTTFDVRGGKLCQIVHPEMRTDLPMTDLSTLHGEVKRAEVDQATRSTPRCA